MSRIEKPPVHESYINYIQQFIRKGLLGVHEELHARGIVRKINDDYLYWSDVKYRVPAEYKSMVGPADLWSMVKNDRLQNRRYFEMGHEGFCFTKVDSLEQRLHEFDLRLAGGLNEQVNAANEESKYQYLIGSIMEESIASSQIEGAVTSRVAAKDMLRKNRSPRNESEQMITNNYQTIQHIIRIKNEPLTPTRLLEIHRLITAETLDDAKEAGQLRQHDDIHVVDVVKSEIIHTPPSFLVLPSFVEEFCQFFNDETPSFFIHPVVKASIIHFIVGYFHPFTDGNGRTARALFYWYLLRKGYWLTEYLSISRVIKDSRTQYYRSFQQVEADENDLTYFIVYQVQTLSRAYEELKKYIDRKNEEKQQRLYLQRNEHLSPRQAQIVEWVHGSPNDTLSIKEVQTRLGVSNQTARNDIRELVKLGFLSELPVNGKETHYMQGHRSIN